jgi:hypothetical protein
MATILLTGAGFTHNWGVCGGAVRAAMVGEAAGDILAN